MVKERHIVNLPLTLEKKNLVWLPLCCIKILKHPHIGLGWMRVFADTSLTGRLSNHMVEVCVNDMHMARNLKKNDYSMRGSAQRVWLIASLRGGMIPMRIIWGGVKITLIPLGWLPVYMMKGGSKLLIFFWVWLPTMSRDCPRPIGPTYALGP
jgi:hypothetical protein